MALSDVRTYAALRRKTAYIAAWWLADSQIGHLPVLLALGSLVPIEEAADSEMVRLGESGGLSQPVVVSLKPSSLLQAADHTGFFRLRAPRASRKRRQTSAEAAHPLGEPTGTFAKCNSGLLHFAKVPFPNPPVVCKSQRKETPMARNDGVNRTVARNQDLETPADVAKIQEHNEREKDSYSNQDIVPERTSMNVHFKTPTDDYVKMFEQMEQDGVISTRGLKADAIKYGELVFDVNSAYFYNHGGYEFAKQFYAEAYQAAVKIVGGEQYILSAVMHADEVNRAMSEALGQDVYHYHLHVVYVPVVEKQILWSKRCKDKALVGTVKETMWLSQPALDEAGNPVLQKNGKPVLKKSYSILQDDFYQHMRAAGYTDVERGERGSTEEHLTVTQFKVAQEQQRLEDVTAQIAQKEQTLDSAQAAVEKKQKELQSLQKQTKEQRTAALTVQEIRSMGKKTITGNITLTPSECDTLKDYAVNGILAKAENSRLEAKLQSAQKSAAVWKQRYESLKEQAQPYLEAVKLAPEKVRVFLNAILTRTRETKQHDQPARRKSQDMEL